MAVFDRCDYKAQMETILNGSFKKKDGSIQKYYKQVDQADLDVIRDKISSVVTQGYNAGLLTDFEFDCMLPGEIKVGRLYGLAKDHKQFIKLPELTHLWNQWYND